MENERAQILHDVSLKNAIIQGIARVMGVSVAGMKNKEAVVECIDCVLKNQKRKPMKNRRVKQEKLIELSLKKETP